MNFRFAAFTLIWAVFGLAQTSVPQNTIEQISGPAALAAGTNSGAPLPTVNVWLTPGSWISAGTTPVVLTLEDGNSVAQGNAWAIPANTTVYPPAGSYFPKGIVVSCASGCGTGNASYSFHFKVVSN